MKWKYLPSLQQRRGLLIIITAALLLEMLSGAQYYLTHQLMEGELEKRAENELTMKAILIKSNLNDAEEILNYNMWDIQANLGMPDSAYAVMRRMATLNPRIRGVFIGFEPYYYPQKGKWYEVYARQTASNRVETAQIGGPEHDYTQLLFYTKALEKQSGQWADPYFDKDGAQGLVTTFSRPVYDRDGRTVGVTGVDLSLKWLTDTIDRRHIYHSSFLLLLTEDGLPVIQPSEERISKGTSDYIIRLINDSTVERSMSLSGRSEVIHFKADGRNGTVFHANMKGQPHWQLAVVCYDDEVYASLSELRVMMALLMLVAFALLLYMVWRFARGEKKLEQKTLEQERIDGELRIASDIQRHLLPEDEPSLAGVSDVEVEGRLIPAKAVGGDLYNAFVRDGKLFFCIGDVSGKGIPAALIMAITQTLFRHIALREDNPARIMEQLNVSACRNNKANVFITMFVGVLNLPTGHLRYCNAGHDVPILVPDSELDVKANLPIGLFGDFCYEQQEMTMKPGDTLFLYTDGLTEAMKPVSRRAKDGKACRHELFGRERVLRLTAGYAADGVKALVDNIIAAVQRFADGTEQSDDLTLLAISYTPREEQLILDETLTLTNDVREVALLSTFVKDVMARLDIGKPLAPKLRLALEEAVVNVMEYAYPAGTKGSIDIRVACTASRLLKFVITDAGISFNPTEATAADTTLSAEERPVGGLGILLVRELMDSINYERTNGKNVLTLKVEY